MNRRLPHAELRSKVRDPGFTPSVRDTAGLVALLADDDEAVARDAERAMARIGSPVLPRVVELAKAADAPVRAGIARLLGRMQDAWASGDAHGWLLGSLEDSDPRVRRAAAVALGKRPAGQRHGDDAADANVESALLGALGRETGMPERRAMVTALGRVGSGPARQKLRDLSTDDPELARIRDQSLLMLSRAAGRAIGPATIADEKTPDAAVRLILRCREGLEDVLREEVATKGADAVRVEVCDREPGVVHALLTGPMRALFALRTMTSFTLELGRTQSSHASQRSDEVENLVDAFTSPATRRIVEAFTLGPVRYRIAWGSGGHRRSATWRAAKTIAERCPEWINDPTGSTWEVVARVAAGRLTTELRPRALVDPRFYYRKRDVPAASHPTIAAALVHVAGVRADDVVWDPFVGSGTELVERAFAGAYAELHGSDVDPRALDAARENIAAAGLEGVLLVEGDATTHAPRTKRPVTLVITNPPMGRRVARTTELGATLERFVDHVARVLAPQGRFVWLSPLPGRTADRAKLAGLLLRGTRDVDMGGFTAQMQTFVKEP
jgi:23S rRNA G2445 N2-methylase RlmL